MKCKNKCKIEASIAEAYILEEVSNFTTKYYGEKLPSDLPQALPETANMPCAK